MLHSGRKHKNSSWKRTPSALHDGCGLAEGSLWNGFVDHQHACLNLAMPQLSGGTSQTGSHIFLVRGFQQQGIAYEFNRMFFSL